MAQNLLYRDPANTNGLVNVNGFDIGGTLDGFPEITIKEIVLAESLLTPGLQTTVTMQSAIYTPAFKNFDMWKNQSLNFSLFKTDANGNPSAGFILPILDQKVYRMDNRDFMPVNVGQTEEFTIHACHPSLLNDAKSLVSKSWKCTSPSDIVEYVLQSCAGVGVLDVESADPSRDYIAENIHPFQVVAQQANVALADGDDPSFVHYMTYDIGGTHHFKSLKNLCQQGSIQTFHHSETGYAVDGSRGYSNPNEILAFMFPCDFDYLADVLNGLDENGMDMNTGGFWNPLNLDITQLGNQGGGCGIGGYNYKQSMTNKGTSQQMNGCDTSVEKYLLKRQARMSLLEKDKIALRLSVPWNPNMHVGKIITLEWKNKNGGLVYGSGDYLITSMQHVIRLGGFSVTTMECVSRSVGGGVV